MPASSAPTTPIEPTRVRRFSVLVGLVVIVVVGFTWGWRLHNDPLIASGDDDSWYRLNPWDDPDPGTVIWSGNTISGPAGTSVLRLKAADRPTEALGLMATDSEPYIRVFTYDGAPRTDGTPDRPVAPEYLSSYHPTPTVLPDDEKDLTLWFYSEAAWTASVTPLDTTPLTDEASGRRQTYLHYVGPDGPHQLHMSCLATPEDPDGQSMYLDAYTSSAPSARLGKVACPGEATIWLEQVPTLLQVDSGLYGIEWSLTLEPVVASPAPEPTPGG